MCDPITATVVALSAANSVNKINESRQAQQQMADNANRANQAILDNYMWDSKQLQHQKSVADQSHSQIKQDSYLEALKASDTARVYSTSMGAGGANASGIQREIGRQGSNIFNRLNQQQEIGNQAFQSQLTGLRNQAINQQQGIDFYRPNPLLMWSGVGLDAAGAGMQGRAFYNQWQKP